MKKESNILLLLMQALSAVVLIVQLIYRVLFLVMNSADSYRPDWWLAEWWMVSGILILPALLCLTLACGASSHTSDRTDRWIRRVLMLLSGIGVVPCILSVLPVRNATLDALLTGAPADVPLGLSVCCTLSVPMLCAAASVLAVWMEVPPRVRPPFPKWSLLFLVIALLLLWINMRTLQDRLAGIFNLSGTDLTHLGASLCAGTLLVQFALFICQRQRERFLNE